MQGGDSVTPRDGYLGQSAYNSRDGSTGPLSADFTQAAVKDNQCILQ